MSVAHERIVARVVGSETEFGWRVRKKIGGVLALWATINRKIVENFLPKKLAYRRFDAISILPNQSRGYGDGSGVPELATAECLEAYEVALYETANIRTAARCVDRFNKRPDLDLPLLSLYKSDQNCELALDGSVSQGLGSTHGNYLTFDRVKLDTITKLITPFNMSRWGFIGNGWIDMVDGGFVRFLLSQRTDLIGKWESPSSAGAGESKPLVGTRVEPHADANVWRRYHDPSGNQNMSEWQIFLKHGMVDLVLMMIEEEGFLTPLPQISDKRFPIVPENYFSTLKAAVRFFNSDIFGEHKVELADGRTWSALDFQRHYIEEVERYFREERGPRTKARDQVLEFWKKIADAFERKDLAYLARYLDWAALLYYFAMPLARKMSIDPHLLIRPDVGDGLPRRDGILFDLRVNTKKGRQKISDYLKQGIIEYANVRTQKSPYGALLARGLMERLFTEEEIARALSLPPQKTRARAREIVWRYTRKRSRGVRINGIDWTFVRASRRFGTKPTLFYMNLDPYCSRVKELEDDPANPKFPFVEESTLRHPPPASSQDLEVG